MKHLVLYAVNNLTTAPTSVPTAPSIYLPIYLSIYLIYIYIPVFIRAKRVSNCYIQEKKNCPSARVRACSTNLGFSVDKIVLVLV